MSTKSTFLALASFALPAFAQWTPEAWTNWRDTSNAIPIVTNAWAVPHTVLVTNYYGGVPAILTNRFLTDVQWDQLTTNNYSGTNTITAYSNNAPFSWQYVYAAPLVQTNIRIQPREAVCRDAYFAVKERMQAITNEATVRSVLATYPPAYRNDRESLVWVKSWVETYCTNFLDVTVSTGGTNYTSWLTASSNNIPHFVPWTLLQSVAPSNYLDETPWRAIAPVDTGWGRVQTCTVTFTASATTITNLDCCGFQHSTTNPTNRQVIVYVCTNAMWTNAGAAWQSADSSAWGWRYITNLFARMIHTRSAFCGQSDVADVSAVLTDTAFCDTEAGMETAISATWAAEAPRGCDGTTNAPTASFSASSSCAEGTDYHLLFWKYYLQDVNSASNVWHGEAYNRAADAGYAVGDASSNLTHRADLYVKCPTNVFTPGTNDVNTFYDYGYGFTTNFTIFDSSTATGPTNYYVRLVDDPQNVPLPDAPQTPTNNVTGYGFRNAEALWVIRWDMTNGFRYR